MLIFVYVGHSEASDTPKSQTLYLQKQIETCKMAPRYKKGQMVTYKPIGGPDSNTPESVGRINDVLTEPGMQANRNVQASADNPRYEVSLLKQNRLFPPSGADMLRIRLSMIILARRLRSSRPTSSAGPSKERLQDPASNVVASMAIGDILD